MDNNKVKDLDLKFKALELYKPPFIFRAGYIHDSAGSMVADEAALRIRGWGRIGRMDNAEELQDKVGELIAEAMTNYWELHVS